MNVFGLHIVYNVDHFIRAGAGYIYWICLIMMQTWKSRWINKIEKRRFQWTMVINNTERFSICNVQRSEHGLDWTRRPKKVRAECKKGEFSDGLVCLGVAKMKTISYTRSWTRIRIRKLRTHCSWPYSSCNLSFCTFTHSPRTKWNGLRGDQMHAHNLRICGRRFVVCDNINKKKEEFGSPLVSFCDDDQPSACDPTWHLHG